MTDTAYLEAVCQRMVKATDACGVLMLVVHRHDRAEIVAAFQEDVDDLPGKLRRLADEVESGSGISLGRHGQKITT